MALPLSAPVDAASSPATMQQVQNEAHCQDWVTVQSQANGGFPAPVQTAYLELIRLALAAEGPTRAFVAYEDSQPVACSLLHITEDVAGIWQVGTVPNARRRGYGTTITQAALAYGQQHGCRSSVLIATALGHPVYEHMGYTEITKAKVYLYQPG